MMRARTTEKAVVLPLTTVDSHHHPSNGTSSNGTTSKATLETRNRVKRKVSTSNQQYRQHRGGGLLSSSSARSRKRQGWWKNLLEPWMIRRYVALAALLLLVVHFCLLTSVFDHVTQKEASISSGGSARKLLTRAVPGVQPIQLTPLSRLMDVDQYTVRINTWKRQEQLRISVDHYRACPGVAQVQVVWCDAQGEPPAWLLDIESVSTTDGEEDNETNTDKAQQDSRLAPVVVERHVENSLNERFHILSEPRTLGVLSVDDDVLRPCLALDVAFYKWTLHPERMVGFDARTHTVESAGVKPSSSTSSEETTPLVWSYGYKSTTEKTNQYSTTLTRFTFLHRDYLYSYMRDVPKAILQRVQENLNCEDIAMSLWVSAQTGGLPPLLADFWAVRSQIKLYSEEGGISQQSSHKELRDACVNDFADWLHLKNVLKPATLFHASEDGRAYGGIFEYGIPATSGGVATLDEEAATASSKIQSPRLQAVMNQVSGWRRQGSEVVAAALSELHGQAMQVSLERGLIEKTPEWKRRFQQEK